ncbi:hypothetical protein EFE41_03120 [Methanohalophilus portucalensis FDF-1]|uniref:Sulfotransferase domain-containing protein n=3 Tax=Methanohalophilus portucalensis TaxID=39664 RepID=A0A3M9LJW6_9EURY|nr:hypothetical protein BKM01_05400 [Methanohalophilus portucalensis]RNI13581.1 hypothetical protein EFE41_03120 [Methanohalophilus portucalensis FDF-1]
MLVLIYDELKKDPTTVLSKIYDFLGVTNVQINLDKVHNTGTSPRSIKLQQLNTKIPVNFINKCISKINLKSGYSPMASKTKKELKNYFEPYNQELQLYLNKRLGW